jgi:hypothetical protein
LSVVQRNYDPVWWVLNAFGSIWNREEILALILKENGSEDSAKPWFSNRQLSVDFVTLVREQERLEGVQELVSREEGALGVRRGWGSGNDSRN